MRNNAKIEMSINQALVRREPVAAADLVATQSIHKPAAPVPELTEDLVNQLLAGRGLRGWLRAAKVASVLGLLSLYLFLDTYEIRADFNRRTINRLREKAREAGRLERLRLWTRSSFYEVLDRFIRVLRYIDLSRSRRFGRKETPELRSKRFGYARASSVWDQPL